MGKNWTEAFRQRRGHSRRKLEGAERQVRQRSTHAVLSVPAAMVWKELKLVGW